MEDNTMIIGVAIGAALLVVILFVLALLLGLLGILGFEGLLHGDSGSHGSLLIEYAKNIG